MNHTKQRLFVDCQVFQHATWNRGMGRYTLKLLSAIDKKTDALTIILNKNIPIDKQRLNAIKTACPSAKVLYIELPDDPNKYGGWRRLQEICSDELDKQLSSILQPDDTYIIAANFAIRYCSVFPTITCKKVAIFWDITPYIQWDDYKNTPDFEPKKYFAQFKTLYNADQLWAISQSAADEARFILGIHSSKVVNIRGASIRNLNEQPSRPKSVSPTTRYIVCPSADGPNKNNENMVRGFAAFNEGLDQKYKLVITSDFSEQSKTLLESISSDLIFTGHVSDGELGWLYQHCEALLFASKTEGLGLPILEAVGENKKVVCSDIPVFKEISEEAFYFADPYSAGSIELALRRALIDNDEWEAKKSQYQQINTIYSWTASAEACLQSIDTIQPVGDAAPSENTYALYYSDSDGESMSRNIAEVLYADNQSMHYYAMRDAVYTYNKPSYLIDMGVARHALRKPDAMHPIYLIDRSQESLLLLLQALRNPGSVVIVSKMPSKRDNDLRVGAIFGEAVTYEKLLQLLDVAGNKIITLSDFADRGSSDFVSQVQSFGDKMTRGEIV